MNTPILELNNISKKVENFYLENISITFYPSSVHAIMGENGSGKSLLMHLISGDLTSDTGTIRLMGNTLEKKEVKSQIHEQCIHIHQEPTIINNLSIPENIFLYNLPLKNKLVKSINYIELNYKCKKLIDQFNLPFNTYDDIRTLGLAQKQLITLCRAYVSNAKIVILDSPSASLTPPEKLIVYRIIEALKDKGTCILYITHTIEEVCKFCDYLSILRKGHLVTTEKVEYCTSESIVKLLSTDCLTKRYPKLYLPLGKELLYISNLCCFNKLHNISFSLREGEILGITGLAGSGRTLLAHSLFGDAPYTVEEFTIMNHPVSITTPYEAISNGIALIPENRSIESIFKVLDLPNNIAFSSLKSFSNTFSIDSSLLCHSVSDYASKLNIKIKEEDISTYTEGEQQKAIFAKWIMKGSKIFILDEPTKGLDVAAKIDIYNIITNLVKNNAGIILISSDIEEILGICDRVAVLADNSFVCDIPIHSITQKEIIELATSS